jgi:uncharacterized surface protein with fasciclin (FAS1) repeats
MAIIGSAALAGCGAGGSGRSGRSVYDLARDEGLTDFLKAADAAGLTPTLRGDAQITVFAPNNRAFSAAGNDLLRSDDLQGRMAYHVVPGAFGPSSFSGRDVNYTTTAGASVEVDGSVEPMTVGGARVIGAGREAGNGVLYVIDRVLDPR